MLVRRSDGVDGDDFILPYYTVLSSCTIQQRPMKITILTLFPSVIEPYFAHSIMKRAIEQQVVSISTVDIRGFATNKHQTVDDRPYGGGAGMVMQAEPVVTAVRSVLPTAGTVTDKQRVLLTSARGRSYSQAMARELAELEELVIIAGHYEGVDERVSAVVDDEVSIGDFVMTGGELAAAAITDSVVRLIPGVLTTDGATEEESFYEVAIDELIAVVGATEPLTSLRDQGKKTVQLLEYPHYTRPETFEGMTVPEILLGGNHLEIGRWRLAQAYRTTIERRPDLLS